VNNRLFRFRALLFLLVLALLRPAALCADGGRDGAVTPCAKESRDTVSLPVIMYHDILKSRSNLYTVTPKAFERDLKWLHDNGYRTVGIRDIVNYVEKGKRLPKKPVMLTFDDGRYNNVFYGEPILEKYGMKAVMFVVGEFSDASDKEGVQNPNYSSVTWDEQRRMVKSGLWEIQSHTYTLHRLKKGHKGVSRLPGESGKAHRARLLKDLKRLDDKIAKTTGTRPQAFAYPYGILSDAAEEVLLELGHKASFTSCAGISQLQAGKPESLRLIKRFLRAPATPAEDLIRGKKTGNRKKLQIERRLYAH